MSTVLDAMATSPRTAPQKLAEVALEFCGADSAGLSFLSPDTGDFYWPAIAGVMKTHAGEGTPRDFGPSGVALDRNAAQLFTHPERHFPYLAALTPPIEEALVVPFYAEGKAVGTIWAIAHNTARQFDSEDLRRLESLQRLAGAVYTLWAREEREVLSRSLREINAELLISSVRQHELAELAQDTETTLRKREGQLASELASTLQLQEMSTQLIAEGEDEMLVEQILDAAVIIMHSDFASFQMLHPERGPGGELRLLGYRGFTPEAARMWEWVEPSTARTSCAVALRAATRVIVQDVQQCDFLAGTPDLEAYLRAGIHAMQSTPLISRNGRMLGMISTHWRHPHQPAERDLQLLDVLARQAADFIERSGVEKALRESEARYRTLFDLGPVAIYSCDAAGVIQEFNDRAAQLWGRKPNPGDTDERFCGSFKLFRPDGVFVPHHDCPMADVISGKASEVCDTEVLIERPDGSRITVVVNIRPLKDDSGVVAGAINCFYDISERKRAEQALREGAERLRFMAESMPQKIFTATAAGDIDYFNQQWWEFTGLSFDQLKNGGWTQLIHPDELEQNVRLWRHSLDTGDPFRLVQRFRRFDGAYRWHLTRAHRMPDTGGRISLWIGSSTEIHDEQEREEELRRANADLSQFAFAASHDFQEPLRMITAYSQLLLEGYSGQLAGEAAICVNFIAEGTRRMRELLADLLSFTEVGSAREAEAEIDLSAVVTRALQNLKVAIEETGAVITSDPLPSIQGREAHLLQLFQNLIGNAIKYRGEQTPRIHVSAQRRTSDWLIGVSDNGIGIEPEYFQQIFGAFKRLHGNSIPGTGIGLAICQRVVERAGGRIWVESQPGHGSTFYFTVPVTREENG